MRQLAKLVLLAGGILCAQAPTTAFAVASIHPSDAQNQGCQWFWPNAETFQTVNTTITCLVRAAFGVEEFQIRSQERLSERAYDVLAKVEEPVTDPAERRRLVGRLLEERFGLKAHRDVQEGPVYQLTITKGGHKLKEAACHFGISSGAGVTQGRGGDMPTLSKLLSTHLRREVQDATGLSGCFDFSMRWTPLGLANPGPDSPPELPTALQEQLGLRLESSRGTLETLIVDHVETPSEN